MSGFKFECFYYPTIEHGEVVKTTRNVRSFEFGEEVPTKTLVNLLNRLCDIIEDLNEN